MLSARAGCCCSEPRCSCCCSEAGRGRQLGAHADAVVVWLRGRMTSVTADFETALKQREATISAKESRAAKLSGVSNLASPFAPERARYASNTGVAAASAGSGAAQGGGR